MRESMKILLVINPTSRHGRAKESVNRVIPLLRKRFQLTIVGSERKGNVRDIVLNRGKVDAVIVAGGDGTVHEAVNGILVSDNKETPLGIIPVGTGNDAARSYGIPFNTEKAVRTLFHKNIKKVDVGKMNDVFYANSLGMGLDGMVAGKAISLRKNSMLKGVPLYIKSLFQVLKEWEPFDAHIFNEYMDYSFKATLISVNIGRSYGGGFFITPEAVIDDGLFNMCAVKDIPKWQIPLRLPFFIIGRYRWMNLSINEKFKEIQIEAEREVFCQLDGEIYKVKKAIIKIVPRALNVFTGKKAYVGNGVIRTDD